MSTAELERTVTLAAETGAGPAARSVLEDELERARRLADRGGTDDRWLIEFQGDRLTGRWELAYDDVDGDWTLRRIGGLGPE